MDLIELLVELVELLADLVELLVVGTVNSCLLLLLEPLLIGVDLSLMVGVAAFLLVLAKDFLAISNLTSAGVF